MEQHFITPANGDLQVAWDGKVERNSLPPQIDGLAEWFNTDRTLTDMLAKKVEQNRRY